MKITIIFNSPLNSKKDVFIADNENDIFSYNDQKLQGNLNHFIYEVLDISYDWLDRYENTNVLDGMDYFLSIIKDNKTIKEVVGHNAFPENFHDLVELLNEVKENGYN